MRILRQIVFCLLVCSSLNAQTMPQRLKIYGIALVRLRVSDEAASRRFYQQTLGLYPLTKGCFSLPSIATCYHLSDSQQLEIVPGAPSNNAVESVGFQVPDAAEMRDYLLAFGVKCGEIMKSNSGDKFFETFDPENHRLIFLTSGIRIYSLIGYPGDSHLIHAGFVVHDRAAEDHFYQDILGFHVYWHGGMKDDETRWVDMQVPDGTDWIEYMLNVTANADHHTLGVMNHIALGVPDIHAAEAQLRKNGWTGSEQPKIGRGGKWQLNLYDPDDTRVELMEFTPTQKPCCSEYTGPHPGQHP